VFRNVRVIAGWPRSGTVRRLYLEHLHRFDLKLKNLFGYDRWFKSGIHCCRNFKVGEMLGDTSDDLTYNLILMHNMSHAMERRSRPHWKLAAYGAPTVMDSFIVVSDSASSGDDEPMQRRRRYAIRTVISAVTEAGISDGTFYTPRRGGSVPGRAPNRDRALLQGAIDLD
jgi:hypothetical protein